MQTRNNFKKHVTNFFGALGYMLCSLLWLWTVMLYFSWIEKIVVIVSPNVENPVVEPSVVVNSSSGMLPMFFAIAVTIIMAAVTIYIIIKIPSVIINTSKKVVHNTADNVTPIVLKIQHKGDNKKNRIKLSFKLVLVIKILLIVIPIILTFCSQFIEKQLFDLFLATYVSFWIASLCVLFFAFQYFLASLLSVKRQDLW